MAAASTEDPVDRSDLSERERLLRLQRLLLPASLPAIGCTQTAAGYLAHNHSFDLGGDWYDLVDRPDDKVVGIIGDVVGHGAEQINVMGQLRAASNAFARVCSSPAEILSMKMPPLGMFGPGSNHIFEADVGDLIVLYTDGVVDRIGPSDRRRDSRAWSIRCRPSRRTGCADRRCRPRPLRRQCRRRYGHPRAPADP